MVDTVSLAAAASGVLIGGPMLLLTHGSMCQLQTIISNANRNPALQLTVRLVSCIVACQASLLCAPRVSLCPSTGRKKISVNTLRLSHLFVLCVSLRFIVVCISAGNYPSPQSDLVPVTLFCRLPRVTSGSHQFLSKFVLSWLSASACHWQRPRKLRDRRWLSIKNSGLVKDPGPIVCTLGFSIPFLQRT